MIKSIDVPLGKLGSEWPTANAAMLGAPHEAAPVPVQLSTVHCVSSAEGKSLIRAPLASEGPLLVKVTV